MSSNGPKNVSEAARAGFQSHLRPLEGNTQVCSAAITGAGGLLTAINLSALETEPTQTANATLYANGSGGQVIGVGRSLDSRTAVEIGFVCGHASAVATRVAQVLIVLAKPTLGNKCFIRTPVWRGEVVAGASLIATNVRNQYVIEAERAKFAQAAWANNFTPTFNEAISPGVITVGKGGTGFAGLVLDTSGATHIEIFANCTTANGGARSLDAIAPVFANW